MVTRLADFVIYMKESDQEAGKLNAANAVQSTEILEMEEIVIDSGTAYKQDGAKGGEKSRKTNAIKENVMAEMNGVGEGEMSAVSEDLQSSIKAALLSKPVIDAIVKAVSIAVTEKVSNDVYTALEFDLESKVANITKLEREMSTLKREIKACHEANEEHELYSRRNCLRFHGIHESPEENTDDLVIEVVKEKLKIDLKREDLDRSHRIPVRGRRREGDRGAPPNPIIVKFIRYNRRREIYDSRSKLKGTNIFIHEDLTRERSDLLFKVRSHNNVKRTWTYDGRIFALMEDGRKVKITKDADLERLN